MPALVWSQPEGRYESGIERGTIHSLFFGAAAWNGLISVVESKSRSTQPYYQDGMKYFEHASPGDYSAKIQAFTYPDLLDLLCGVHPGAHGALVYDQFFAPFNMTYRTRIGNPTEGLDYGYKLHLVYNLTAIPSDVTYPTVSEDVSPIPFEWTVSGIPAVVPNIARPSCHISFNSINTDPAVLAFVENRIYGSGEIDPYMQSPTELFTALNNQFGA